VFFIKYYAGDKFQGNKTGMCV